MQSRLEFKVSDGSHSPNLLLGVLYEAEGKTFLNLWLEALHFTPIFLCPHIPGMWGEVPF